MTYRFEWIAGPILLGTVLLPVIVPSFALIGLVVVALAVLAALAALAGGIVAAPFLLARSLRRRLGERREPARYRLSARKVRVRYEPRGIV